MEQIKPCPFCGSTSVHVWVRGLERLKYATSCDNCDARSGRKPTKKEALQEWNRRADEEKSLAREFIKAYTNVHFDEWTLSKKIYKSKCRYCGGDLEMYTHKDRSFDGSKVGYLTMLFCHGCAGALFDFSDRKVKMAFPMRKKGCLKAMA